MTSVSPTWILTLIAVFSLGSAILDARWVGRSMAIAAGVLGAGHVVAAVHSRRLWESAARRMAYVSGHATGVMLDRAVDAALGAAMLAMALGCWTLMPGPPAWSRRTVAVCVCLLATAAVLGSLRTGLPVR